MFDRILLPTDGSEAVRSAIETALNVAGKYDAELHVLFVMNPPTSVTGIGGTSREGLLDELRDEGEQATSEIATKAREQDIAVETTVRPGNPREDIISYAEENDIDLIVMGTHGRTGVKRTLLGSVTEAVIRHSDVPVLTVHREPED